MSAQGLTPARYARTVLGECVRKFQAWRARYTVLGEGEARGLTLLREWLSVEQRAQFDRSRYFEVIGCDTGRHYRICYRPGTNVYEIDEVGRPLMGWCFVPSGHLAEGDVMLAQKIALETDERAALAVANKFPVQFPFRPGAHFIRRAY